MQYRVLGRTGIEVSVLAFGAGPISTLMVGEDRTLQDAVFEAALSAGINWFDTAATYGTGQSERSLGRLFNEAAAASHLHVATKVRLMPEELADIRGAVLRSFAGSLQRLQRESVTLLQLHNAVTLNRGDEPTSITPADVLEKGGVADAFEELRGKRLVKHLGLTGIGHPDALRAVIHSGRFDTAQVPYHLLNPSAGQIMPAGFTETDYGNVIADCAQQGMGVLAIRVFAGGALADNPPSPHTLKTPFFPLALYERDRQRGAALRRGLPPDRSLNQVAVPFALAHPNIHSAIVGFGAVEQVREAVDSLNNIDAPAAWPTDLKGIWSS